MQEAIRSIGDVPDKDWERNGLYSWAYRRHESKGKKAGLLDLNVIRAEARVVGRAMSAHL